MCVQVCHLWGQYLLEDRNSAIRLDGLARVAHRFCPYLSWTGITSVALWLALFLMWALDTYGLSYLSIMCSVVLKG